MLRGFLASVISLSVSLSPAAADQQFVFRYKIPALNQPATDGDFEAGNDIQAFFVTAVGRPFSKQIPVKTREVEEWTVAQGDLPEGLALSQSTGLISGVSEHEEKTAATINGAGASGAQIARARVRFESFQPIGQVSEVNWYTHTGEYFYAQIPAPQGIDVVRWDPIVDQPADMRTYNGSFQGRATSAGSYGVAWRGYDYLDREVAFTYGELLVQDGPVIEEIKDQTADKGLGEAFKLLPEVKHSIGTLTYKLKPVTSRPAGIEFNPLTGRIGGVFGTFDTTARFVIEARDSGSGRTGVSNTFALTTLPETLDLANMPDLEGVVGKTFLRRIAAGSTSVDFALSSGMLPDGIELTNEVIREQARGVISGRPTMPETVEGLRVTASGSGVADVTSNPFRMRVYSSPMEVTTAEVHARVGQGFRTSTPNVILGQDPPYRYENITPPTPETDGRGTPAPLEFDAADGTYSSDGFATAGIYDQRILVANQSNRLRAAD